MITGGPQVAYLFCLVSEDKDIFGADFLEHLDVRAIQRADRQGSVERDFMLPVRRPRCRPSRSARSGRRPV